MGKIEMVSQWPWVTFIIIHIYAAVFIAIKLNLVFSEKLTSASNESERAREEEGAREVVMLGIILVESAAIKHDENEPLQNYFDWRSLLKNLHALINR